MKVRASRNQSVSVYVWHKTCVDAYLLSPDLHLKDDLLFGHLQILLCWKQPPLSLSMLFSSPLYHQKYTSKCVTDPEVYFQSSSRPHFVQPSLSFAPVVLMAYQLHHTLKAGTPLRISPWSMGTYAQAALKGRGTRQINIICYHRALSWTRIHPSIKTALVLLVFGAP